MTRNRIQKPAANSYGGPIYSSVYGKKAPKKPGMNRQAPKRYYYTSGDLGFDKQKFAYIAHLIKRFNEFKKKELGKENMDYFIFENSLKKIFFITDRNQSIYHLPADQFEILAEYIQKRINATKFAVTLGKNHKNYSSYEEYTERQS
jgi:hypothetical protein